MNLRKAFQLAIVKFLMLNAKYLCHKINDMKVKLYLVIYFVIFDQQLQMISRQEHAFSLFYDPFDLLINEIIIF